MVQGSLAEECGTSNTQNYSKPEHTKGKRMLGDKTNSKAASTHLRAHSAAGAALGNDPRRDRIPCLNSLH